MAHPVEFGLMWGGVRLGIGILFGLPIAFTWALLDGHNIPPSVSYAVAFGPARLFEWGFLLWLVERRHAVVRSGALFRWVLLGVAGSMALDGVAMALKLNQIKFVC